MVGTTLPLLGKYVLNFSQFQIGLLVALLSLSSFLTTVLINAKLNSRERRLAFIFSSAAYTLTFIGFWDSNVLTIWLFSAASGATLGLIMPNIITSAGLFDDQKIRERVLSLYTITLSMSLVAGPAIESYLLKFLSLRLVFLSFTVFGLIVLLFSLFLKFPEENRIKEKISVIKNNGFRVALLNILIYNIPFSIIISFLGIYEREYFRIGLAEISLIFSLFFFSSFISRLFLFIKPPQRIKVGMIVSISLTIAGILLMILSQNIIIFAISLVIMGVPHGLAYPLSVITLGRSFKPEHRNVANSYYFSSMMVIGIIVPVAGGFLIDNIGFKFVFILLLLIIALLIIPLVRELKIFID
jgi:predicted MFS family arabinose efflux permease